MIPTINYQAGGIIGVNLLTTTQAIERCVIQKKPINRRTFFLLAEAEKVKPIQTLPNGNYIWKEEDIERMRKRLPKKRGNPGDPLF